ncbi:MAG: hypothetical protein AAFV53_31140 [Myxococcota bacterium]
MAAILWSVMGCQYLQELRDDPVTVQWSGNVYALTEAAGELVLLEEGGVTLTETDGAVIEDGYLPFDDSPGFWRFDAAPTDQEVAIRVDGADLTPTVWRGRSPTGLAIWLSGVVYAREVSIVDDLLTEFDGLGGVSPELMSAGTAALLWGEPLEPEDDWANATIEVVDGDGTAATVWRLVVDEDGTIREADAGEPLDLFLAPNLAPGTVTMTIDGAQTDYNALGGDVLSAVFYDLEE